ncbi:hypothetical protein ST201phi2-1p453 [Pseudomonas phage 201phi2-1]|uniref:Uncharacterized protein n=1 Tax=Pseudomonas phage 201phi2-1 TaxID=198110 RepID=B3FJW1_BP201|nr:hypothetical protein ST201phi2-1p453 [Pseudomonas phage 201phi2-1]ABY63276.1 hypothetical protein 201phi2-1p453 [Pseudomonas phage 201phi2-1]
MIPVLNITKLREVVNNTPIEERRAQQKRSMELIKAAIAADTTLREKCIELGIPYQPCVAAVVDPMSRHCR